MRPDHRCVFCNTPLASGDRASSAFVAGRAFDPERGRLWEICSGCGRWNPVAFETRWDQIEALERAARDRGEVVARTDELALVRVEGVEVVRVGDPPFREWGGVRYGTRFFDRVGRSGFWQRLVASLPPLPLEGYDPYGLTGPMGGVAGKSGPSQWLASPFLDRAPLLTLNFASMPFVPTCPSCAVPMPLNPWDFEDVSFHASEVETVVEATCANCGRRVAVDLATARPALRAGLAILDSDDDARVLGQDAGVELERVGGPEVFVSRLSSANQSLGGMSRLERIALAMALDYEAELEALETAWDEAEEIARVREGDLTETPEFQAFRTRILNEDEGVDE